MKYNCLAQCQEIDAMMRVLPPLNLLDLRPDDNGDNYYLLPANAFAHLAAMRLLT